ncbi:MAG: hypothetical protein HLUCCO06_12995 [Halomonas sp. HL-93]|nr:MAG: hypothetical protein HLUCCO06_12995 [Halomonas sp. HL-93]
MTFRETLTQALDLGKGKVIFWIRRLARGSRIYMTAKIMR